MIQTTRLVLQRVEYMPRDLDQGILYVSEEFGVAGHLCACGCGNKVVTPLGPVEWKFSEKDGQPTLWPSIGSWQLPCQSHYWIRNGEVHWARRWTTDEIAAGRENDARRLRQFYGGSTGVCRAKGQRWGRGARARELVRRLIQWLRQYRAE